MKVYEAIRQVTAALSASGIAKSGQNAQQGYKFRGIDAVMNALSGPLCDASLTIVTRCTERIVTERATKNGGAIFYVALRIEFDFIHTEDQSKVTVVTYGEAMDSADKATSKAMSAAYKYMALLTFCVPTEPSAESDADYTTHEVHAKLAGPGANFEHPPAPGRQAKTPEPAATEALPESQITMMLHAIQTAVDMRELRNHFNAAFVTIAPTNDAATLKRITGAKDTRKLHLDALASAGKSGAVA